MTLGRPKKWTEDLCLAAMRRYLDESDHPDEYGYEAWRKETGGLPSARAIISTLGGWDAAKIRAAGDGEQVKLYKGGGRRGPRIPLSECLAAITLYERHCQEAGTRTTWLGYHEYQRSHSDLHLPPVWSIDSWGSWHDMRLRAAEAAGTDPKEIKLNWPGGNKIPLSECLAAITLYERYCQESGTRVSRPGYHEYQRSHPDLHLPSASLIASKGSWNEMRLRAAEAAGTDPKEIKLNWSGGNKIQRRSHNL